MADGSENGGRKRSLTSVTLQWLSEKLRRSEHIKEQVASGQYRIDSEKIAASLVTNGESE